MMGLYQRGGHISSLASADRATVFSTSGRSTSADGRSLEAALRVSSRADTG
jgi:hypothetical protein